MFIAGIDTSKAQRVANLELNIIHLSSSIPRETTFEKLVLCFFAILQFTDTDFSSTSIFVSASHTITTRPTFWRWRRCNPCSRNWLRACPLAMVTL
jgi:hypothetical protein